VQETRGKIERSVGVFKRRATVDLEVCANAKEEEKKRLGLASASTASYPSANVVAAKSLAAKETY